MNLFKYIYKRVFCLHPSIKYVRNLSPWSDTKLYNQGFRSKYECRKCGKIYYYSSFMSDNKHYM